MEPEVQVACSRTTEALSKHSGCAVIDKNKFLLQSDRDSLLLVVQEGIDFGSDELADEVELQWKLKTEVISVNGASSVSSSAYTLS